MDRLVLNEAIHEAVFKELIPSAKRFLWVATADLKDLHIQRPGRKKFDTFLGLFDDLVSDGVEIRLIHAKEP
ncbi:MAG: phosphatidylserine synthase, partial [Verrucomicrobiales bacterium]